MKFDVMLPIAKLLNIADDRAEYLAKWVIKTLTNGKMDTIFNLMLNNNFTENERYFISFFVGTDFGRFLEKRDDASFDLENETKH